eukprot:358597-Chlamydomonas_euryale.AAC.1
MQACIFWQPRLHQFTNAAERGVAETSPHTPLPMKTPPPPPPPGTESRGRATAHLVGQLLE